MASVACAQRGPRKQALAAAALHAVPLCIPFRSISALQYPVEHPEKFEKYGMAPSKGVLFYGPPGERRWVPAVACSANHAWGISRDRNLALWAPASI